MAQMNRIILHHAASTYRPSGAALKAYHGCIDGDGARHNGKFPVEANAPGRIRKGHYAAHTWHLNTGSIGRSILAMAGGKWADPFGGKYPVKPAQVDALVLWVIEDVRAYSIPVDRQHVLSHAEVQPTLGVVQKNKWDFDYGLRGPCAAGRDPVAIGDELRQEILLKMGTVPVLPPSGPGLLKQGSIGEDVERLQRILGVDPDGQFGPVTFAAVIRFQRAQGLLPDGIVGSMTWAALNAVGST